MTDKTFTLTKNEREIMDLLWTIGRPLSRADIIKLCENRSWKASSIHILLNQLLDKGAIGVDGFVKTGKNYGRTFSPVISEEEYQVMQFRSGTSYSHSKKAALVGFVSTLLQEEEMDEDTIDRLEALLQAKKAEMK